MGLSLYDKYTSKLVLLDRHTDFEYMIKSTYLFPSC